MRIAFIEPYPSASGSEEAALEQIYREQVIAADLYRLGNELLCAKTTRSEHESHLMAEDVVWHFVPIDANQSSRPDNKVVSTRLADLVKNFMPDVLIVRGAGTRVEEEILRIVSAPLVTIVSGRYRTSSLTRADLILGEHRQQMMFLRKRVGRRRVRRLQKLPAPWFFGSNESPNELRYDIVVISKFEQHKNHQALDSLMREPLRLALIGDGSLRDEFATKWKDVTADVDFLGSQSSRAVADVIRQSRLLVHPSSSEGFPRCVAEAMASGVPCVAIRGVVNEPVKHGGNGLTVREDELHSAVTRLLNDEKLLSRFSESARLTAEREFGRSSLEGFVGQLNSQLNQLKGREAWRFSMRSRARRRCWDVSTAVAGQVRRALVATRSRLARARGAAT